MGLLHQHRWVREQRSGKKAQRQQLPIEQKESYRWLTTLTAAEQRMPASVPLVHIGDREADIFELFAQPRAPQSELLIRAEHKRKVKHELGYLLRLSNKPQGWDRPPCGWRATPSGPPAMPSSV